MENKKQQKKEMKKKEIWICVRTRRSITFEFFLILWNLKCAKVFNGNTKKVNGIFNYYKFCVGFSVIHRQCMCSKWNQREKNAKHIAIYIVVLKKWNSFENEIDRLYERCIPFQIWPPSDKSLLRCVPVCVRVCVWTLTKRQAHLLRKFHIIFC